MNIRQVLIGLAILCAVIFLIDPMIINWVMGLLTPDLSHSGIIRFLVWCLLLWLECVALWLSLAIRYILGAGGRKIKANRQTGIRTIQKSKWAERFKEIQKLKDNMEKLFNSK